MKRKPAIIAVIAGSTGIIGGILIVIGALLEEDFPKALWIAVAICEFFNAIMLLRIVVTSRKKLNGG